ncbi:hypothetical protein D3C84_1182980 [compost metagenome]
MAVTALCSGMRSRAFMTKLEKAKNNPPIRPHPRAVARISNNSKVSTTLMVQSFDRGSGRRG